MKYAIFSDVHSNYEALKTFLLQTDAVPALKRVCLGDIVGYSSRPNECIRLLLDRDIPIIMGNHDYAIYSRQEREKFNEIALEAIEWHAEILLPEYRKFLVELPFTRKISPLISVTHGDFSDPQAFLYVTTLDQAQRSMDAMPTPIGFFGHTHIPVVYCEDPNQEPKKTFRAINIKKANKTIPLDPQARYLINPGSLGQPRDGEPRASYAVLDGDKMSLSFQRFEYDYTTESNNIRRAKLPAMLADRILVGY